MEPNFDWTATVAERKIQEAVEAGEFDNLPGKGKPLDLDTNPFEPAHMRAVNRVLKNAKALPEWLQLEKDIEQERETLSKQRERTLSAIRRATNAASRDRMTTRLRDDQRERLRMLNTLILKHSFIAPNSSERSYPQYNVTREMALLESALAEANAEASRT